MKNKIVTFLIYAWATVMVIIIVAAIGKVLWKEPYAWIGVGIVLIVLFLTRNVNILTIGTKKVPKSRRKNEYRNKHT